MSLFCGILGKTDFIFTPPETRIKPAFFTVWGMWGINSNSYKIMENIGMYIPIYSSIEKTCPKIPRRFFATWRQGRPPGFDTTGRTTATRNTTTPAGAQSEEANTAKATPGTHGELAEGTGSRKSWQPVRRNPRPADHPRKRDGPPAE